MKRFIPIVSDMIEFANDLKKYIALNVFTKDTCLWLSSLRSKYRIYRRLANIGLLRFDGSRLDRQEELIAKRDFDVLIVLDACRYDTFADIVHDYLDGVLKPVLSPASVTIEWLKRVWGAKLWKDIIYVSASPLVNKRGLLQGFDARNKFLDIVEVWDWGWAEDLCTVPPDRVNIGVKIAKARIRLMNRVGVPNRIRIVAHYVQPHAPYVSMKNIVSKLVNRDEVKERVIDVTVRKLGRFVGHFSIDYVLLGVLKDYYGDKEDIDKVLRWAYIENLRWVLKYVAELSTQMNGRLILTADHGELLGEYGLYFHMDLPLPQLRVVPWFVVKV